MASPPKNRRPASRCRPRRRDEEQLELVLTIADDRVVPTTQTLVDRPRADAATVRSNRLKNGVLVQTGLLK
jgi:hypothetical protein